MTIEFPDEPWVIAEHIGEPSMNSSPTLVADVETVDSNIVYDAPLLATYHSPLTGQRITYSAFSFDHLSEDDAAAIMEYLVGNAL